jgi:tryptophanyl-tRNA synthetase
VGALRNWVAMQDEYDCIWCAVDWHALMSEYKSPANVGRHTLENVAEWLACGVDPAKAIIFVQSHVPEHVELAMALACVTPLPWVERVPTFKEQLRELKEKDVYTYAFLGYPVLQAADILLYGAEVVPVGEDQLPHLELTREICRRFNSLYGEGALREPQARLTPVPKLLGLDRRKMSKSYGNCISLGEEPGSVRKKITSMITDEKRIRRSDPGRPEVCNVHGYYQAFAPEVADKVAEECRAASRGCVECKKELADRLNGILDPIRRRRAELLGERRKLESILRDGAERARALARPNMEKVRELIGFWR